GLTSAELAVVDRELVRQCDGADGLSDGIIANVAACRDFNAAALQCQPGETEGCIAPDRAEAVRQAMAPLRTSNGMSVYSPYPWDTGITFSGPGLPGYLPVGQGGPLGPPSTAREMDVDQRIEDVRWDAAGRLTDTAHWTNLSTYLGRGSKLMFFHGVSDPWFSAFDTWDYYQRAQEANGAQAWDDAARFYMVPGMGHCAGGNAFDNFDLLGPMVGWVENGAAPGAVTARRSSAATPADAGATTEMPLCPHPSYAHYTGGDANRATSFECRMP
ncbi:MAG: tannase/feruloyl esterase family alpha/beta hydrolase, partial [Alteraurantiacibacter sp.]